MAGNNNDPDVQCGGGGGRQGSNNWSDVERSQFEQGVIAHGWGSWAAIARANIVPTRDRKQLKSHAQKIQLNHPADYQRLLREHAANLVSTPAAAVGRGNVGVGTNIKVKVHRKRKTPPRMKARRGEAKTQAARPRPRLPHRLSAPDANIPLQSGVAVSSKRYGTLDGNDNSASTSAIKSATAAGSPKKKITSMQPLPSPKAQAARASPRLPHRLSAPVANIPLQSGVAVSLKRCGTLGGNDNSASASAMKSATAAGSPKKRITSMQLLPSPKAKLLPTVINGADSTTVKDARPPSTSSKSHGIISTTKLPMPLLPVGVLSDSTNDKRHTTLGCSTSASSSVSFFDVKCPHRPYHPFEMSHHEYPPNPNFDELPASTTTVTPSSGHMPAYFKSVEDSSTSLSAFDANIHDCVVGMNTDDFDVFVASDAAKDAIGRACNEEKIDPLYQLELEDHMLDIMMEYPEPPCNVMFDRAIKGGTLSRGGDSGQLFAVSSNNIALAEHTMASGGSEAFHISPNVRPDYRLFMQIRSFLMSPPDANDPKENIFGCAGRGGGYLFRARIKKELGEHLSMCWWREDVFDNHSRVIISSAKVAEGDRIVLKKYSLERLVALIAVMLDVDHWRALRDGTTSTAIANTFADDEDDIRHVGQLLTGLWERVSRSLHRDGFVLLGGDFIERTERNEAINKLVERLDLISRQVHIKSRRLSP
jgi:hypothetical protein